MPGTVTVDEPAEGVVRLTIANAAKRGALDHPLLDALTHEVGALAGRDDVRAVVLTGADGQFSSGYDIGDIPDESFSEQAEKLVAHPFTNALDALDACDLPIVAALTGHTIGGGLELSLCCDFRIAADGVKLGMPPAKLGLVYSHTGLRRFIDTVGVPHTRELFLLGRYVDADVAEAWGLVNATAPADELEATALDWATTLVANAPLSIRGNKQIIRALLAEQGDVTGAVEAELLALREASFASEDMAEGVKAFAERRPANWKGR